MKAIARALALVFSLGLFAPACLVHTYDDPEPETVRVGFRSAPSCSPSRYWNGHRCAKKRWASHHESRRYHWR